MNFQLTKYKFSTTRGGPTLDTWQGLFPLTPPRALRWAWTLLVCSCGLRLMFLPPRNSWKMLALVYHIGSTGLIILHSSICPSSKWFHTPVLFLFQESIITTKEEEISRTTATEDRYSVRQPGADGIGHWVCAGRGPGCGRSEEWQWMSWQNAQGKVFMCVFLFVCLLVCGDVCLFVFCLFVCLNKWYQQFNFQKN